MDQHGRRSPPTIANDWRSLEPGLDGIGVTPAIGIGQRALLVQTPEGNVLWDCVPLVTEETVARIAALGGVVAMAASHPHFYAAMVSWSEALSGVPIHLPLADKDYVMRPSAAHPLLERRDRNTRARRDADPLRRPFRGQQRLALGRWRWAAKGSLMTGDTIQVAQDTRWAGFMRSYPNLIPLPAAKVRHIAETVRPYAFERLYGGWWERVMASDAHAGVQRSAERYIAAIRLGGAGPPPRHPAPASPGR